MAILELEFLECSFSFILLTVFREAHTEAYTEDCITNLYLTLSQLLLQLSKIEEFILTKLIIIQPNLRTTNVYPDMYINKPKVITVPILGLIFFQGVEIIDTICLLVPPSHFQSQIIYMTFAWFYCFIFFSLGLHPQKSTVGCLGFFLLKSSFAFMLHMILKDLFSGNLIKLMNTNSSVRWILRNCLPLAILWVMKVVREQFITHTFFHWIGQFQRAWPNTLKLYIHYADARHFYLHITQYS